MESISQCITAASPCKISLNVILCVCVGGGGLICLALGVHKHFLSYCTYTPSVYHICPRKIFISVKGLHRVSRENGVGIDADDSSSLFHTRWC